MEQNGRAGDSTARVVLYYFVVGAFLLASATGWWVMNRRFRAGEHLDHACAACGSAALQWLAVGAYRCGGCGHEGGWGWAAYRDALRTSELARLDPTTRLAGIRADLQTAYDALLAAVDEFDRAGQLASSIVANLGEKFYVDLLVDDDAPDVQRTVLDGTARMYAAQQSIHEARLKLASGPVPMTIELPHVTWQDDEAALPVLRVRAAREAALAMLATVDAARTRAGGE